MFLHTATDSLKGKTSRSRKRQLPPQGSQHNLQVHDRKNNLVDIGYVIYLFAQVADNSI